MSRLHLKLIFGLLAWQNVVFAQTELKQILKFAKEQYQKGDYYYAKTYYEKAMAYDSNSVAILWEYAQTLRAYQDYENAAKYYKKVVDKEATKIYTNSALYLGMMQQQCGNYDAALETFKYAKKKYAKDRRDFAYKKARQAIRSCLWAQNNLIDTQNVIFEKLPPTINTKNAEFGHFIHDKQLIFSSLRADSINQNEEVYDKTYHTHLFTSKMKDSIWDSSQKIEPLNFEKRNSGNGSFSLDGKRFYFSLCDEKNAQYNCKIMVARYQDGKWQTPDSLGEIINQKGSNNTQPFIGKVSGEEWLFFASDRPDGKGGMDIYFSKIKNGNQYSRVRNMRSINTEGNEITPFWDAATNSIYFSSDWYEGFGGFDVFSSHTGTYFEKPKNAGIPTNSPANDVYFFKNADTNYISSNRKGVYYSKNPTCCSDVFSMKPIPVPPKETPEEMLADLNKRLPVRLYFHNDIPNPDSWDTTTNVNYIDSYNNYIKMLPKYQNEYAKGLEGIAAQNAKENIEDFFTEYVEQGVKDLALFRDLLLKTLQNGAKINISVKGFASPLAKTDYNVNLTKRRIWSLKNYIHEWNNGIFLPYLNNSAKNGAYLTFTQIPFGEYTANKLISDNINDQKNSIYSRAAAFERKIEIQSVTYINEADSLSYALKAQKEIIDLGKIVKEKDVVAKFVLTNTVNDTISITEIVSDCACIKAYINNKKVSPHQQIEIIINLNPENLKGKVAKSIVVTTKQDQHLKLNITAEIK